MTDRKLLKYQAQARKLGVDNINAHNVETFLQQVVEEFRTRPCMGRHLPTVGRLPNPGMGIRRETTLYEYYQMMIRDTVKQIRKPDGEAYLFSIEQISDVIKCVRDAQFTYLPDSDCFRVSM